MNRELEEEFLTRNWFAEELVKHLESMGADRATIPIKREGEIYEIEVHRITGGFHGENGC